MIALKCYSCALRRSVLVALLTLAATAYSQEAPDPPAPGTDGGVQRPVEQKKDDLDHRILGVLPNYRTANPMAVYQPITPRQKFAIAIKDSFDWPNYLVAGAFAGLYQLEDQNPAFGQGLKGYAHRYWTSYVDQSMGNVMVEGVMATVLHEDPRYFRKVTGSAWSRTGYALTRVLVTRTDRGATRFNFSEVIGNGVTASLANAYYPDNRGLRDTTQRLGVQIATDSLSNVLKEFWPDIKRWLHRRDQGRGAGN
jgi:hypothetical protein